MNLTRSSRITWVQRIRKGQEAGLKIRSLESLGLGLEITKPGGAKVHDQDLRRKPLGQTLKGMKRNLMTAKFPQRSGLHLGECGSQQARTALLELSRTPSTRLRRKKEEGPENTKTVNQERRKPRNLLKLNLKSSMTEEQECTQEFPKSR